MLNGHEPVAPPAPAPDRPAAGNGTPHPTAARRIACAYLAFGLLWVWLTDWVLKRAGGLDEAGFWAATGKGTGFVAASALLVFWLGRREFRAIARTNDLLRAVIEGTTDAVYVKDLAGRYLLCNAAAARLVGLTVADVLGNDDTALFDADGARRVMARDRQIMTSGRTEMDEAALTAAGVTRTYQGTKAPYRNGDGAVVGLVGVSRDVTEQKEAQRQLRAERDRLEKLMEAVPVVICSFEQRPDGGVRFPYASTRIRDIYGLPAAELSRDAAPIFALYHPDDVARVRASIEESARTLSLWRDQFRVRHPDRGELWVEGCSAPVRQPDGSILWHGYIADVTDRKRTERTLRETRDRLNEAQRIARSGSWSWEPESGHVWWSEAIYELFGLDPAGGAPTFDGFLARVHPDDRPVAVARVEAVLAGADGFANDVRIVRPDGRTIWIHSQARVTRAAGRLVRVEGTDQDITDRKRAEEALRESEELFRATFEQAAVGMAQTALDGRFTRVNGRFVEITGYSRDELLARRFRDITHPDDVARDLERAARLRAGVAASYSAEKRYVRKDGTPVWVHLTASLRRTGAGEPLHFIAVIEDISERRRIEGEVRQTRQMLRTVLDTVPHGVFWKDRDSRYLGCNRVVALALGFDPPDRIVGRTDADLPSLTPDQAAFFVRTDREVMDTGSARLHISEPMSLPDGRTVWLETNKVPLRDADGRVVGILGTWEDVTARERSEAALRDSEARFKNLIDLLPDAVYINAGGRVVFANPACARLFGAAHPDQLLGLSPFDLMHPDDHAVIRERIAYQHATGRAVPGLEERIVRLDGRPVPVHVSALPVTDRGTQAILVVLHDLTERKRIELQLRHQELMLREAAELAHVGGWGFDPVTLRGDWTAETARIHDLEPAAEATVTQGLSFFAEPDRARIEAALKAAVEDGTPYDLELQLTSARGVGKWVRTICRPIVEGGRVVRVRGSLQDITDRKRAEEEIRQLNAALEQRVRDRTAELEAANKELEAFSYSVSHDLRAPLRAIDGFSRIVLDEYGPHLPEAAREYLAEVRAGTRRMGRLVDDLLAFSRLGRTAVERRLLDPTKMVEKCLAEVLSGTEKGRIEARIGPLPGCAADPALLRQVWLNLLSNAVKYSAARNPAVIEVGTAPDPTGAPEPAYFVRDNGVGFDMRYAHKLFGVFQRLHRAEEYEGTGIGLALVQRIVHRHGGRVWAEAAPDRGAAFFFTLGGTPS
jgi:PAS domain S-box-containing protein